MTTIDYRNAALTAEQRTEDLLKDMTLREKAGLMFQPATVLPEPGGLTPEDAWNKAKEDIITRHISHLHVVNGTHAEEIAEWTNRLQQLAQETRLGIPITFSTDPRNGFGGTPFTGQALTGLSKWPDATGIAASGDPQTAKAFGDTIRQEFLAMGIRLYLGPMADLFTEPRWSRGWGTFGEDVEIASTMVAAFIEGLRGSATLGPESLAAVVKHFPGAGPQQGGHDAHDARFPEQVYPGNQQELHLRPFEAAFAAGVTQVMPYYGMPVKTEWDERGFAFNVPVIDGLLRKRYHFDGIVVSDWNVIDAAIVDGHRFGPNAYGVESLTPMERIHLALAAGIDQFGGDRLPELVVQLVQSGQVTEDRINTSVRRLLLEKFRLGLFDNRFVDIQRAAAISASPALQENSREAQRASLTLIKNETSDGSAVLPLIPGTRVYAEGFSWTGEAIALELVASPDDADICLIHLQTPWSPDPDNVLGDLFHSGSLEFDQPTIDHLAELAAKAPVVASVYLERPAVLSAVLPHCSAVIGEFGVSPKVLIDVLTGASPFTGTLPFDLPSSYAAVTVSREDVPFDTASPLFTHGHGLTLDAVSGASSR
ncbi:glycoside hydrolase family 3 protein [Paenarthrobacter sp. NPDC058040]|uniref:glycoside hydrolase family 3 protein n=1 Tax=unclassified Paenarthrobacter TaxID=2634190 RepID=UPI0036DCA2D0